MHIFIGGAWPYANGYLHIGHIASLLPGDVLARYYRAKGNTVVYVSGSDCFGTPVALRAKQEGVAPETVSERYHKDFVEGFAFLGFSYDVYGKTTQPEHRSYVQAFHRTLYRSGYVYEKVTPQAYCSECSVFLADRFVIGLCPVCKAPARGDQCDDCGSVLEPEQLHEPVCAVCGQCVAFRETKHLYLAVSQLEAPLRAYLAAHDHWRKNARACAARYVEEGLRDRAITRDLDWGIPVPRAGFAEKRIYIWAENVLGYLSVSRLACEKNGVEFNALWGEDARHCYVHGKDNIPFHTIILPALLLGHGGGRRLPDDIISSEHLTLEGQKISTSRDWAVWVKDLAGQYEPDSIRYFLLANGPQKRDTDFSWEEYVKSHNGELLGAYGNFIHRTLAFLEKQFDSIVPPGLPDAQQHAEATLLFGNVGACIEKGDCKSALEQIFERVRASNRFFDREQPWVTKQSNPGQCGETLYQCVQRIAAFAVLLSPFLPFTSAQVRGWLGLSEEWRVQCVPAGTKLPPVHPLFVRLGPEVAAQEREKLHRN